MARPAGRAMESAIAAFVWREMCRASGLTSPGSLRARIVRTGPTSWVALASRSVPVLGIAKWDRRPRTTAASGLSGDGIADTFSRLPFATIYGEGRNPMTTEDLIEIERAGRRCGVCHSGRGWRRSKVVRSAGRDPVMLCGSCRARFDDDPPVERNAAPAARKPRSQPKQHERERQTERRPDRLRAALRKMPGSFSTAMGCSSGRTQQRQGARPTTGSGASRQGPAPHQPLVDRTAPK
jgi:hypothetical protein